MLRIDLRIIADEATVVDVGISAIDPTELLPDIREFVARIVWHGPVGRVGHEHRLAIQAAIPIAGRVQPRDGGGLSGEGIAALDPGKPEHLIERAVASLCGAP